MCVFLRVCALGEERLCQSRWGYILCFMATKGCINHSFIKRLWSPNANSSPNSHPKGYPSSASIRHSSKAATHPPSSLHLPFFFFSNLFRSQPFHHSLILSSPVSMSSHQPSTQSEWRIAMAQ